MTANCWKCGRKIKYESAQYRVEVTDGGLSARKLTDPPADESDPGYLAWLPVGEDCAKRMASEGYDVMWENARKKDSR